MAERLLEVRVTPRSSREAIAVDETGIVRIAVRAAPADNAANEEVLRLLARALKMPRTSLHIQSGHSSRTKFIDPGGLSLDEALHRIASSADAHGKPK
jgi:uncharacterized protein YggU (UPF0235/DUF167 family)